MYYFKSLVFVIICPAIYFIVASAWNIYFAYTISFVSKLNFITSELLIIVPVYLPFLLVIFLNLFLLGKLNLIIPSNKVIKYEAKATAAFFFIDSVWFIVKTPAHYTFWIIAHIIGVCALTLMLYEAVWIYPDAHEDSSLISNH
ncbi:MAG: hypothetical protein JWO06_1184 [Bacteroidota bacterium]|nr:hypothetical protein [Bacteroidota bacterium]